MMIEYVIFLGILVFEVVNVGFRRVHNHVAIGHGLVEMSCYCSPPAVNFDFLIKCSNMILIVFLIHLLEMKLNVGLCRLVMSHMSHTVGRKREFYHHWQGVQRLVNKTYSMG